jgi:hypothetical protein
MDSLVASRITISVVIFLYSCYHAWLGLSSLYAYSLPQIAILLIALYVAISFLSIAYGKSLRIPGWMALTNLLFTAVVTAIFSRIIVVNEPASYATWFVVGLATLMGITSFRGHVFLGWLGFLVIADQIVVWGGVGTLLNAGVVGALLMVFAGNAAGYAIRTAEKQANEAIRIQQSLEMNSAGRSSARRFRQERIQLTLQKAEPLLSVIVSKNGKLSKTEAEQAKLLEAELRDLIRGRGLVNDRVSEAANRARSRGVKVELLDEGGLENVEDSERNEILERVAQAIDGVNDGKITVRSPQGETWRVTIAAMSPSRDEPSVWERI